MKKLFTLIIALGSMTALFAQQGQRQWSGEQHGTTQYSSRDGGRGYQSHGNTYSNNSGNYNNSGYSSGYGNGYSRGNTESYGSRYDRGDYNEHRDGDQSYRRGWYSRRPERHFRERRYYRDGRDW